MSRCEDLVDFLTVVAKRDRMNNYGPHSVMRVRHLNSGEDALIVLLSMQHGGALRHCRRLQGTVRCVVMRAADEMNQSEHTTKVYECR